MPAKRPGDSHRWLVVGGLAVLGIATVAVLTRPWGSQRGRPASAGPSQLGALSAASASMALTSAVAGQTAAPTNPLPAVEVNTALMVTVELDFGSATPSIAEALREVERRYQPEDGQGRTFAVLDAYGEPTPQGKLHISMHLSMEKPGQGALVFRRTGETLWRGRIVPTTNTTQFTGKALTIYLDDGMGKTVTVDGSQNPATIMQATIKEAGVPVGLFWPDGAEREMTFVYSACGCPVKAMVRRTGEKTVRTKDLPVIFPDDPAALALIARLMGW
jgi:hypothetical protein